MHSMKSLTGTVVYTRGTKSTTKSNVIVGLVKCKILPQQNSMNDKSHEKWHLCVYLRFPFGTVKALIME